MKNNYLSIITLMFCGLIASAQSFVGHAVDNYSGIHGVLLNPSAVVDSKFRTDINLLSGSVFAGSDYFSMNLNDAMNGNDGFNFDDEMKKFATNSNNFFLNMDVLLPSFMFNLSKRSSIAVTTRARAFFNINNVSGALYENLSDGFDESENFDFELRNMNATIHVWGELGLTYGRILMDKNNHFLKGGVTLKYLQGAGSTFLNATSVNGQYDAASETLTTAGTISYGTSQDFDNDDIDFKNLSAGFGGDFGLTYEYRSNNDIDSISIGHGNYKLKVGVSVTDIGSISYDESTTTTYNVDNTVSTNSFEDEDIETALDEQYVGTEEIGKTEISLPTAMHVLVDYKFRKRLYMSVHGSFSLVDKNDPYANRIINTVTATPRLETRWFSFYLPLSLRQYDGFAMGAGFRLGPLTVGSGSLLSNYLMDDSRTADIYVGLKIPVYRK